MVDAVVVAPLILAVVFALLLLAIDVAPLLLAVVVAPLLLAVVVVALLLLAAVVAALLLAVAPLLLAAVVAPLQVTAAGSGALDMVVVLLAKQRAVLVLVQVGTLTFKHVLSCKRGDNSLTSGCQTVPNDLVNKVTRESHIENMAHSAGVHACMNDSCLHWEPACSCRHSYRL